jgi:hypothetical protein
VLAFAQKRGESQERGESMKTILFPTVRSIVPQAFRSIFRRLFGQRHVAVGLAAIAPVIITAVALTVASPARAQSAIDSAAVSDPAYDGPPPVADPPADVPIDSGVPLATAASASPTDDSAAGPSDWARSDAADDEADSDDEIPSNQVLELPQVVDPASGQPAAATAEASTGDGQSVAATTQSPSGDDSSSPDQVGSIDDYQNENEANYPGGPVPPGAPNSYAVSEYRVVPVNPVFVPHYVFVTPMGGFTRFGMNGMNTAIGTTSPLFPMRGGFAPIQRGFGLRSFGMRSFRR